MSSTKNSRVEKEIKKAARNGRQNDVAEMSATFKNNVSLLSDTLIEACVEGHLEVVKWLLENTVANVNHKGGIQRLSELMKKDQILKFTPLTAACYNNHLDLVKFLVDTSRADVNLIDKGGYVPLTMACHRNSVSVSMYL